jgi:Tfp pilus assembly protein PilX
MSEVHNMSIAVRAPARGCCTARASRGISLVFSLITLAALSLAAVALIRSVDTGATILGNLSFRQDTVLAAEEATRQATAWLADNQASVALRDNLPANGYLASSVANIDPSGHSSSTSRAVIDWTASPASPTCSDYPSGTFTGGCLPSLPATAQNGATLGMANGVRARYLIVRLCNNSGDAASLSCARPLVASAANNNERNEVRAGGGARLVTTATSQYFRILVRAQGARNTVTYTETLVHF